MDEHSNNARNCEDVSNSEKSMSATFSFDMLDMIITNNDNGYTKPGDKINFKKYGDKYNMCDTVGIDNENSQKEKKKQNHKKNATNNITEVTIDEKNLFGVSLEEGKKSKGIESGKRKTPVYEQSKNSDEQSVDSKKKQHKLEINEKGKKKKKEKKKITHDLNTGIEAENDSQFSLLDEFIPGEDIYGLTSCKQEALNGEDMMNYLSGNSNGRRCNRSDDTFQWYENQLKECSLKEELAKIEEADDEVLHSKSIDCANCKYYLKELTTRNFMNFSYMDQYINEGENNLLLLKNKKIEELENVNKLMKHKIIKLKKRYNFLNNKMDTFVTSLNNLKGNLNRLIEENNSLKEENKKLSEDLELEKHLRGKTVKEDTHTQKKDAFFSSRQRKDIFEKDFENSIDNELFNEFY
ncbi:hypothetical protein, conserved [Plasmodium gonderi]|uniref:Uncharacterized protein n=1 Tax=Plasmodium gonderi TaxID=77519 RepID=A0A1Y1JGW5_PLAGO|nr:hypothetical protein, conserved [Plasmodium gonderi]GAW81779.1 hypothetical protein, conserved [Plasmodium gonderi]